MEPSLNKQFGIKTFFNFWLTMTVWLFVATGCSSCEYKSGSNQGKLLTHLQKAGGCTLDGRWYYRHLHLLGSELQENAITLEAESKRTRQSINTRVKMMNMQHTGDRVSDGARSDLPSFRDIASLVSHLYSASFFSMVLSPEDQT